MHQTFQLYLNLGFIKNPRCTSAGNLLKRKRVIMVNINIYNTKKYTSVHVQRFKQPNPNLYPYSKCKWKSQNERKSFPPLWPVSGKVYPIWILGQKKYPFSLFSPQKIVLSEQNQTCKNFPVAILSSCLCQIPVSENSFQDLKIGP